MTAHCLFDGQVDSPRYSVVGECSAQHAVSHVGILEREGSVANGQTVSVFHMANPIARLELPGEMTAHVLGWVLDLTDDEFGCIEVWLEEVKTTSVKIEYLACPATQVLVDKINGRPIGRAFSCAGFVCCCFAEALKIMLLVPEEALPDVSVATLQGVWGEARVRAGRRYGLRGPGPWKVLLPSYLFHALTKARAEMPHRPEYADPCFPTTCPEGVNDLGAHG